MPTLIDSLVVTLGLDPRDFTKGQKDVAKGLIDTRDAASKTTRDIETGGKRAASYMASLKTEVIGLFLAFTGASGLKALAGDMIGTAATIGRLSDNIGVSTEHISVWQGVVEQAGGTAAEAQGSLRQMAMALGDMKLGLRPANAGILQAFGINQDTAKNPLDMMLRIADASKHMDRLVFTDLATRLGFSDATIALLAQGRKAVEKEMETERKFYELHKKDTDAARDFNWALKSLKLTIEGELYPALTPMLEGFSKWISIGDHGKLVADGLAGGIIAIAGAAVIANAEVAVLAGAVTGLVRVWQILHDATPQQRKAMMERARNIRGQFFADIGHGDFAGAWNVLKNGAAEGLNLLENGPGSAAPSSRSGTPAAGGDNADQILGFFKSHGYSDAQAQGILAAIRAENDTLDPNRTNGKGSGAYGIGQWLSKNRVADFRRVMGKPLEGSSLHDQMAFMLWEMNNTERGAGGAVRGANSAVDAGHAMVRRFYRPGAGTRGDLDRVHNALAGARSHHHIATRARHAAHHTTTIGTIVIHTDGKSADQIAREIHGAINKRRIGTQADGPFN